MPKFQIKKNIAFTILAILWIGSLILVVRHFHLMLEHSGTLISEVEYMDSTNTYNKMYYDKEFNALKDENKELYDSLKKYKDKVSYLLQFNYEKQYETGMIETSEPSEEATPTTFEYTALPNDTFEYKLLINADKEPYWYSLSARFKEKFTIVNKSEEDMNHITIKSEGKGDISDVTVFKKKEKKKLIDRIGIGPGVTAGYDPINRNFGIMVGMSVTYDLK